MEFLHRVSSSSSKGAGVKISFKIIFSKLQISFGILAVDRFIKYNQLFFPNDMVKRFKDHLYLRLNTLVVLNIFSNNMHLILHG